MIETTYLASQDVLTCNLRGNIKSHENGLLIEHIISHIVTLLMHIWLLDKRLKSVKSNISAKNRKQQ